MRCLPGGRSRDDAVQEQGASRRAAARATARPSSTMLFAIVPQLRLFVARQLLAGEHDDRHVAQRRVLLHLARAGRSRTCPAARRSSTTQSNGRSRSAASASAPVPTVVIVARRRAPISSTMLMRSAGSSSTTSSWRTRGAAKLLMRSNAASSAVGRERLVEVRERAALEPVLALLLDGDDLHRDVARRAGPASAGRAPSSRACRAGRCRARSRSAGTCARARAPRAPRIATSALEAAVAREVEQHARVVRVVLDDQQHGDRPARISSRSSGTSSTRGVSATAVGRATRPRELAAAAAISGRASDPRR